MKEGAGPVLLFFAVVDGAGVDDLILLDVVNKLLVGEMIDVMCVYL